MNTSMTEALLFPNSTGNVTLQPAGGSAQILLLQILYLAQQSSKTHKTLLQHSKKSHKELDEIKKRLEEAKCEFNMTFGQIQQMRLEIHEKNKKINIQKQTIQNLKGQNCSKLVKSIRNEVDSKTTMIEYLNRKILDLQQQLENKNMQHENISSELLECKIKSNTKTTIIHDPADIHP